MTFTGLRRKASEQAFNPFKTAVSGVSRTADTRVEVLLWLHGHYPERQG